MSRQVLCIVVLLVLILCTSSLAQESSILIGAGKRLVDSDLRDNVLRIIQHRVDTGAVVEPLLIFSPFADPDVLGSIAIDTELPLPIREISANAILDQLYVANPYFQAAASHYLDILVRSSERSLRLKGWVGGAIMEYRLYTVSAENHERRLVQLRYSAVKEVDPRLRQFLDELNEGDPSVLVGSAAWSQEIAASKPYRSFDVANTLPSIERSENGTWFATAWNRYRAVRTILDGVVPDDAALATSMNTADPTSIFPGEQSTDALKNLSNIDLTGLLSRFAATAPIRNDSVSLSSEYTELFGQFAKKKPDPYLRALALVPLRFAVRQTTVETFIEMLRTDQSPLVRLSCAAELGAFTDDREVRSRMIAIYRVEEDARVRLHILHSLALPDPSSLPPDVQAFFLSRLREEDNYEVLGFAVHSLGMAGLRSAAGLFSRMLTSSTDPVLRARIAEALSRLGHGTRLRSLDNPRQ